MDLVATSKTDVGREREHNEDFFLVDPEIGLFAVCDGMGGHASGEVASKLAAETVAGVVRAERANLEAAPEDQLRATLARIVGHAAEMANQAVHSACSQKSQTRGAGTTLTALLVHSNIAALAHVGDSRLYLLRNGAVSQISNDHTFVAEALRRGMLTPEEAANHHASNLLTRAVGPQAKVHVDTLVFDILPGDTFLLCSDGLYNYFPNADELGEHLQGSLDHAATDLINLANQRGGEDNITVVLLRAAAPSNPAEQARNSLVNECFETLENISLLAQLTMAELMIVGEALTTETHPKGAVVVKEGDASEAMYIIVSGTLEVRRGDKPLAFLDAGSHFGEMALLNNAPRSATVKASTNCRLLALRRDRLVNLVQANPMIGVKILWRIAQIQSMRLDDATLPLDRDRTVRLELHPIPFGEKRKKRRPR